MLANREPVSLGLAAASAGGGRLRADRQARAEELDRLLEARISAIGRERAPRPSTSDATGPAGMKRPATGLAAPIRPPPLLRGSITSAPAPCRSSASGTAPTSSSVRSWKRLMWSPPIAGSAIRPRAEVSRTSARSTTTSIGARASGAPRPGPRVVGDPPRIPADQADERGPHDQAGESRQRDSGGHGPVLSQVAQPSLDHREPRMCAPAGSGRRERASTAMRPLAPTVNRARALPLARKV